MSGRVVEPDDALDAEYWRQQATIESENFDRCIGALTTLGVDLVVEIGPDGLLEKLLTAAWPVATSDISKPLVLSSLTRSQGRDETWTAGSANNFFESVGRAYKAGVTLSFEGLFAGETRRRISLPDYPFERRQFWIKKPDIQSTVPTQK